MALARRAALVLLLAAPFAVDARAQEADDEHTYFCEVAQPMVATEDRRVEIHRATYAMRLKSPSPGIEVQFTCLPGPVSVNPTITGDSLGSDAIANFNAAHLLGLKLRVEQRPQGTWNAEPDTSAAAKAGGTPRSRFYVDQLRATLDVSGLQRQRQHAGDARAGRLELAQFDALVAATVECILDNAGRSRPPIRKVRLDVVGWDRFKRYGQVYPVKPPTERRDFRY